MALVYHGVIASGTDTLVTTVDVPASTPATCYIMALVSTATYGTDTPLESAYPVVYDDAPQVVDGRYVCYLDILSDAGQWFSSSLSPFIGILLSSSAFAASLNVKIPLSDVPSGTTISLVPKPSNPAWYSIKSTVALFSGVGFQFGPVRFLTAVGVDGYSYDAATGDGTGSLIPPTPIPTLDMGIGVLMTVGAFNSASYPTPAIGAVPALSSWDLAPIASHTGSGWTTQFSPALGTVAVPFRVDYGYGIGIGSTSLSGDWSYGGSEDLSETYPIGLQGGFSFCDTQPPGAPYCQLPLHLNRKIKVAS